MIGSVLEHEDLLKLTGLQQKAALRRHLRAAGVPFRELNGRITTTEEAFTASLVGRDKKKNAEPNWNGL
jgi:hypothetical protein